MSSLDLAQRPAAEILRELAPTYGGLADQMIRNAEICDRAADEVKDIPAAFEHRTASAAGLRQAAQHHRAREHALLQAAAAIPATVLIPWISEPQKGTGA